MKRAFRIAWRALQYFAVATGTLAILSMFVTFVSSLLEKLGDAVVPTVLIATIAFFCISWAWAEERDAEDKKKADAKLKADL